MTARQTGTNGEEVSVFDELELIAPSGFRTYAFNVRSSSESAMRALLDAFEKVDLHAEDWTGSVRLICKACSEGRPHEHDERAADNHSAWNVGVAARDRAAVVAVLEWWARGGVGNSLRRLVGASTKREFESPQCVVQGTRAGDARDAH